MTWNFSPEPHCDFTKGWNSLLLLIFNEACFSILASRKTQYINTKKKYMKLFKKKWAPDWAGFEYYE